MTDTDAGLAQLNTSENDDAGLTFFRHDGKVYQFPRLLYGRAGCLHLNHHQCGGAGFIHFTVSSGDVQV
jgi:hypothetical protein